MATNRENINKMTDEEFAQKFNTRGQNCEVCAYWERERNYCHSKEFTSNDNPCMEGFIKWLSEEDKDSSPTKEKIKTDESLYFIIKEIQRIHNRLYILEKNVKDLDFDDSEYCHMSHELMKRVEKLEKHSLVGQDLILTELKPQNNITLKQKINNIITQLENLKPYTLMNKEKDVNDIIFQLNGLKLFYSSEFEKNSKGDIIQDGYSCKTLGTKTANKMFEDLGYREIESEDFDIEFIKYISGTHMKIGIKIMFDSYIYVKSFGDAFHCEEINEAEDAAIHKKIEELKNERVNK